MEEGQCGDGLLFSVTAHSCQPLEEILKTQPNCGGANANLITDAKYSKLKLLIATLSTADSGLQGELSKYSLDSKTSAQLSVFQHSSVFKDSAMSSDISSEKLFVLKQMASSYYSFTQSHSENKFSHETNSKFEDVRSKLIDVLYEIDLLNGSVSSQQKTNRQKLLMFKKQFESVEQNVQNKIEHNAGGYFQSDLSSSLEKVTQIKHLIHESLYGLQYQKTRQEQQKFISNLVKIKTELEVLKETTNDSTINSSVSGLSLQLVSILQANGWKTETAFQDTCDEALINVIVPGDCSAFFHCTGLQSPKVKKQCAPGTLFNPVTLICDWPLNVYKVRPECNQESLASKQPVATAGTTSIPDRFNRENNSVVAEATTISSISGGLLFTIPQSHEYKEKHITEEIDLNLIHPNEKENLVMLTQPTVSSTVTESSYGFNSQDDIIIVQSAKSSPPLACEETR